MRSKADISQFKLPHGTKLKKWKREKLKSKIMGMLRSIGKQSGESMQSVLKKKRKATAERICRKGRNLTWNVHRLHTYFRPAEDRRLSGPV